MPTSKNFVTYIEDALAHVRTIRTRPMFGEYALYCNDVVVGLICDETLFIKVTPGTAALFDEHTAIVPPYPGGKGAFVVTEDVLEDKGRIERIIVACSQDIPPKKPKSKPKPMRRK